MDAYLYQGTTLIATMLTAYNISRTTWEDVTYTLSAGEADSITDYSALELRFNANVLGGGETIQVSWAEIEVPDVATGHPRASMANIRRRK